MRATSAVWPLTIRNSHDIVTVIDAYYDGTLTRAALPITSGRLNYDDTAKVKRRVQFTVPARMPDGERLDPGNDPRAPLASYGQRVHVFNGVRYANGQTELMDHGWYLITSWGRDGAEIEVEALSLSQLVDDDDFTEPATPPAAATFAGEFVRLMNGNLPAAVDPALAALTVDPGTVYDQSRVKSIGSLCDAWPARWFVRDDGSAYATLPYAQVTAGSIPAITLMDGQDGTVVSRARGMQRGAVFNRVVVNGAAPAAGGAAPHAVADVTDATSPIRVAGPYGRVPRFYSLDNVTTGPQATSVAQAKLDALVQGGRVETCTAVPDPAIELGDVARLFTSDGDAHTGRVTVITLPLTVSDGAMALTVAATPSDDEGGF